jgi:hypothetical protein
MVHVLSEHGIRAIGASIVYVSMDLAITKKAEANFIIRLLIEKILASQTHNSISALL